MGDFLKQHKFWIFILIVFLAIRIFIFFTFWEASADKGGWENFYGATQSAKFALLGQFHEPCDWHPPLYYFFTSLMLSLFRSQWAIYIMQFAFSFISLIVVSKIARLFFSEKISKIAVFLFAVEPFWAWNNLLLVSENLSTPLFLAGFYFFLRFLAGKYPAKDETGGNEHIFWHVSILPALRAFPQGTHCQPDAKKYARSRLRGICLSAVFFGLATLTRANTLLLVPGLSLLILILYAFKKFPSLRLPSLEKRGGWVGDFGLKRLIFSLFLFNLIFFSVLAPWAIRNKIVYGRLTIANILSTNMYFYNLPPLIALEKNISYDEAQVMIYGKARNVLGQNVGDQGDCGLFDKITLNRQLDFFKQESRSYIFARLALYLKIHFVKTAPFFFQPGYMDMRTAYTGDASKPDLTLLFLKGDFGGISDFFGRFDLKMIIYLFGILFWAISSAAVFVGLLAAFFRNKKTFIFFLITAAIVVYSALLVSPFVLARYRLPLYGLFFIALACVFTNIRTLIKLKSAKS